MAMQWKNFFLIFFFWKTLHLLEMQIFHGCEVFGNIK